MVNTRVVGTLLLFAFTITGSAYAEDKPVIRVGMIGLDTSHAIAFTDAINNKSDKYPDLQGLRVVAGFPIGSPDLKSSIDRVPEYTKKLRAAGLEIVDSIPALLDKVDVVMIESVDGRNHLQLSKPVFEAGKLVFIDKPLAASLADGLAIAELGKKHNVAWFSASALRFGPGVVGVANDPKLGAIVGCDAWSPCSLDPTHPDLFWYGIHGVETLFTVMGSGCESVTRVSTPDTDQVTGVWSGGRIGTFRGIRKNAADYGVTAFGAKGIRNVPGAFGGYEPLLIEVAKFFKTGKPPITPEQTIEILAFMEAADASKRDGGKPVTIQSVMEKAHAAAGSEGPK